MISQDILGVCNFDLPFSYALTGWEGSAHDGKVLNDAKTKGLFQFPGKYYMGALSGARFCAGEGPLTFFLLSSSSLD